MKRTPPDRRMEMRNSLRRMRFEDLTLFESVARLGSMAAAARELRLRTPYVTKAVQRMEEELGFSLLKRTTQGVALTPEGTEFSSFCKDLLSRIDETNWLSPNARKGPASFLTLVGPTFLLTHLAAPALYPAIQSEDFGLRLIELNDSQLTAGAFRDSFELALHCGDLDWGRAWKSYPISSVEWICAVRSGHPLSSRASEREVLRFPFVTPASLDASGLRQGSDSCPVSLKQRLCASQVSSGEIGLRAIEKTDQVIFLPEIQAKDLLGQGRLKKVEIKDWAPVKKLVSLTVHQDRLTQRQVQQLIRALEARLA